jgi:transcriptional regulator with XRE-family HTH domain
MKNGMAVGSRVKTIRESRNLTIEEVADRAGLTIDQLKRMEEDKNLPSLAPLIKVARVLGVRLGTFLDDEDRLGPVVCRQADLTRTISFSSEAASSNNHLTFFSLASSKSSRHMEPFLIDIDASSEGGFQLSSHEGEEFIYVLEGSVEITYGKDNYVIQPGESIYYDSIVDHYVHSANGLKARILAVVFTPF